ncbi:hypothetical protein [Anaerophilus nitritogenes]|uniref:hypothetical protein n=1 Tax=Anaerophilus nitritogenes TaxID=2498136 RepID=UPI00101D24B2|nr:hypothetical protein [Anaerophilus nitritogenes]
MSIMSSRASDKPKSHKGKRLSKVIDNGGTMAVACYAETTWKGVLHTTTARVENSKGKVRKSAKDTDINYTDITTDYYVPDVFENIECRSYWKKGK